MNIRPSMTASPPVQPISASRSGTGSVRTTYEPKFVTCRRTGRQPVAAAFVATTMDLAPPSSSSLEADRSCRAPPAPLPCAGDRERAGLPEHLAGAPDAGPVGVQEAAVAAARPGAAAFRLEQDDVRRRVSLLDRERGPQAGEAAADDADVGVDGAFERVGHVVAERGRRLLQPPRGPEH